MAGDHTSEGTAQLTRCCWHCSLEQHASWLCEMLLVKLGQLLYTHTICCEVGFRGNKAPRFREGVVFFSLLYTGTSDVTMGRDLQGRISHCHRSTVVDLIHAASQNRLGAQGERSSQCCQSLPKPTIGYR